MASHLVQGRPITTPVHVRDASACGASYLVRADAVRAVLAYCDLDVTEVLPGKALCTLVFARFADSDLGPYHQFGVAFLVRSPEAPRPRTRSFLSGVRELCTPGTGAFVHWLPVDQPFALEAGRTIWGFPHEQAQLDLRLASPYKRCVLRKDGRLVLDLLLRPGVPLPRLPTPGTLRPSPVPHLGLPVLGTPTMDAYTHLDGTTRRTRWTLHPQSVRTRPGGALIRLGNHPIAKELSELGLPKRALTTTSIARMTMTFEEPAPV
ncbi:acetoacetate decarboxylase family protein [Sphaerisporangium sp. B11E5]|uniref:acetoacetate decarboxylase family protein n=1 Tax=Sphaerisporangium sp. B11E5 TaxID=3153563 RepID=UPI00325F0058